MEIRMDDVDFDFDIPVEAPKRYDNDYIVTQVIKDFSVGDRIQCDHMINNAGTIYLMDDKREEVKYFLEDKVYALDERNHALCVDKTSLEKENIIDSSDNVSKISAAVDDFFGNLDVYKEFKTFPKRGILLYGPPGCGKSSTVSLVLDKYKERTAVVIWPTDVISASTVKYFLKRANYVNVDRLVLVVEDIGGSEQNIRRGVSSDLLALLDDKESIYRIPTLVIATTNYPEKFMESLTNRPGRFDDKLEVSYPNADTRARILDHFIKISDDERKEFLNSKYNKFTAAHIKEVALRHKLKKITLVQSMEKVLEELKLYEKNFAKKNEKSLGLNG